MLGLSSTMISTARAYIPYGGSSTSTYTGKRRKYLGQCELYEEYSTSTTTVSLIRETLHIHDDKARIAVARSL